MLFNHTLFPLRQSSLHNLLDIILDLIFIFKEKKRHTEICFLHSQESNVVWYKYPSDVVSCLIKHKWLIKLHHTYFSVQQLDFFYGNTCLLYYCIEFTQKTLAMYSDGRWMVWVYQKLPHFIKRISKDLFMKSALGMLIWIKPQESSLWCLTMATSRHAAWFGA